MTDTSATEYTDFDGNPLPADEAALLADLLDRVNRAPAEGWRPNPGDVIVGKVTDMDEGSSEYGDDYPLLTILRPNGDTVAVHCFHTVLRNRVGKLIEKGRLAEGTYIAIRYIGVDPDAEVKKGMNAPELYTVSIQQ